MYERVTDAYVFDEDTRKFFEEKNPWALRGIAERLTEAMDRGLWENPDPEVRRKLEQVYLDIENQLEMRGEAAQNRNAEGAS
jgi:cobaltochelatase CobN